MGEVPLYQPALTCLYRVIAFGKFYPNYQISCWTTYCIGSGKNNSSFFNAVTFLQFQNIPLQPLKQ